MYISPKRKYKTKKHKIKYRYFYKKDLNTL